MKFKSCIALLLAFLSVFALFSCSDDIAQNIAGTLEEYVSESAVSAYDADDSLSGSLQALLPEEAEEPSFADEEVPKAIDEDGVYDSAQDVALYLHTYGHLPSNYITKKEAEKLGWTGGSLEEYAPGMCIGGSYFGNYEGNLPEKEGRTYYECDIGTRGKKSRGAKRLVYSDDGLIFYTDDHYNTFTMLYGGEE